MICHQRKIRDEIALTDDHPVMESLDGVVVEQISKDEAAKVILKYEWLGTMPKIGMAYYGMYSAKRELIGVVCFGLGNGTNARNVCGEKFRDVAICLERGACVHWAHPHAGSKLIAAACKLANRDYGWKIFFAYSDEAAGEIGTIYQACNWLYLGRGVGRGAGNTKRAIYIDPNGKKVSSRTLRTTVGKFGSKISDVWPGLEAAGWKKELELDKRKYLHVLAKGSERREMLSNIKPLAYPKRSPT